MPDFLLIFFHWFFHIFLCAEFFFILRDWINFCWNAIWLCICWNGWMVEFLVPTTWNNYMDAAFCHFFLCCFLPSSFHFGCMHTCLNERSRSMTYLLPKVIQILHNETCSHIHSFIFVVQFLFCCCCPGVLHFLMSVKHQTEHGKLHVQIYLFS